MGVDMTSSIQNAVQNAATGAYKLGAKKESADAATAEGAASADKSSSAFGEAAVYEKSESAAAAEGAKDTVKPKAQGAYRTEEQRQAVITQLKADMETRQSQLFDIVKQSMQGQGKAFAQASDDDMWKFLADGNFTVDAATKAQAQADIADDGYWGVDKTSERILDFAKALAGDDPDKADKMMEAFKKGYEEATKTWGKELPDITKKTYDKVIQGFEDWKNSAKTDNTGSDMTDFSTQTLTGQAGTASAANASSQANDASQVV